MFSTIVDYSVIKNFPECAALSSGPGGVMGTTYMYLSKSKFLFLNEVQFVVI